ncbi:protein executer 1 chloroplastic [Phtheirospermum japonicum]|uniref:Protein executer 1 chloroplastic n=1 Tax=Phtheirospermum japonicum TaxID=374723 RepID=A0A830BHH4_9LAMI|nr:protein executer 1 chloroplastic [Phtheirospermum japonicum]
MCPPAFQSPRTDSNPHKLNFANSRFTSSKFSRRSWQSGVSLPRVSDSAPCCRCLNRSSGGGDNSGSGSGDSWRWDFGIHETVRNAIKRIDDYLSSFRDQEVEGSKVVVENGEEAEEWDWEKWRGHFVEVDEQERIVSILKSQLARAVEREDYEDAARIKVAIAAAATNDTVGRVMSHLKKFVEEERYGDAALIRDYAGAGLVGWWAGLSEDANDPYGRIIHISAEYGRYIARSYSPRQLATASDGAPLFEVYLTNTKKGDFKQQAVYLKRKGSPQDLSIPSFKPAGSSRSLDSLDARDNKSKLFERSSEDTDSEDRDDDAGFDNILRDMIPGVKVKVVKVTGPEEVDMDIISKVIEQITDEEEEEGEEEKDYDTENTDTDDDGEIKSENDDDHNDIDLGSSASGVIDEDEQNQISVEVVVGDGFIQKFSRGANIKDLLRVPARLEKKGRASFTFTVEEDANKSLSGGVGQSPQSKKAKLQTQRSIDHVMLDLMKSIGKGKIPTKVLNDVGELINLTISQARNRQPLSGSTTFNRIEILSSSDPLNGLYIGAHGLYTSEVIHMKRKFGQWKEEGNTKKPSKIEFYEYVEAVKLTGDAYVPAGQVAFRAKIGKRYQLPHKGIIPEEFGVIARYRGQGRLAEPGFQNPRWVDGELVILDGKYIKGGPVVGFVYWAPEYHFLVFFNRLRLMD